MEFKGTKGDWHTGHSELRKNEFKKKYMAVYNTVISNSIICVVYDKDNIDKNIRANALLISKAPEMLEMLQTISNALLMAKNPNDKMLIDEIEELIKEATEL